MLHLYIVYNIQVALLVYTHVYYGSHGMRICAYTYGGMMGNYHCRKDRMCIYTCIDARGSICIQHMCANHLEALSALRHINRFCADIKCAAYINHIIVKYS